MGGLGVSLDAELESLAVLQYHAIGGVLACRSLGGIGEHGSTNRESVPQPGLLLQHYRMPHFRRRVVVRCQAAGDR